MITEVNARKKTLISASVICVFMSLKIKLLVLVVLISLVWPVAFYWYGLSLLTYKPKGFSSNLNEIEKCALLGKEYVVGEIKVTKTNPYKYVFTKWQLIFLGPYSAEKMERKFPGHIAISYVVTDYIFKNNIPVSTLRYDAAMRAAEILVSNNWSYEDLREYLAKNYINSDEFLKKKKECEVL